MRQVVWLLPHLFVTATRAWSAHWAPRVIYENDRILAISKPPNVAFNLEDGSVMSRIRAAQAEGLIVHSGPLLPAHRLDRVTSGILLLAKDSETAADLQRKFSSKRGILKAYVALTSSRPKKKQGIVKGDMEKSRRGSWMLL